MRSEAVDAGYAPDGPEPIHEEWEITDEVERLRGATAILDFYPGWSEAYVHVTQDGEDLKRSDEEAEALARVWLDGEFFLR